MGVSVRVPNCHRGNQLRKGEEEMAQSEVFRTYEGLFRVLVEQVIDGEKVDWYLVSRKEIATPDRLVAHMAAVREFLSGAAVDWTGETTESGYVFAMKGAERRLLWARYGDEWIAQDRESRWMIVEHPDGKNQGGRLFTLSSRPLDGGAYTEIAPDLGSLEAAKKTAEKKASW
jgi:hypothetical protein